MDSIGNSMGVVRKIVGFREAVSFHADKYTQNIPNALSLRA